MIDKPIDRKKLKKASTKIYWRFADKYSASANKLDTVILATVATVLDMLDKEIDPSALDKEEKENSDDQRHL